MRVLAIAPHPDDAELHCGGTLAALTRLGHTVAIVDCTRGEMGSRGSVSSRQQEITLANQALGIAAEHRFNLGLRDGFLLDHSSDLRRSLVGILRQFQPDLVLSISLSTRHPDHHAVAQASSPALKAAALHKWPDIATAKGTTVLSKPVRLLRYEAEDHQKPSYIQACTKADWQAKTAAIQAYQTQFFGGDSGPTTSISRPGFLDGIDGRGAYWGMQIGAPYGEAFHADGLIGGTDITHLAIGHTAASS